MSIGRALVSVLRFGAVVGTIVLASCYDWTVVSKGCRSNDDCAKDAYCTFPDLECGKGKPGECTPRGEASAKCADPEPVCTCEGKIEDNRCKAAESGHDLLITGCDFKAEGLFECGYAGCPTQLECDKGTSGGRASFSCSGSGK